MFHAELQGEEEEKEKKRKEMFRKTHIWVPTSGSSNVQIKTSKTQLALWSAFLNPWPIMGLSGGTFGHLAI